MEFNQIHYSIKVRLVVVLLFVILSMGCMAAIAQDSNGVWVLTNGPTSQALTTDHDSGPWKYTAPILSGNSITGRLDFSTDCPEGPGYVAGKVTWTEPPSILTPGTKMNITVTLSAQQQPSCKAYFQGVGTTVYVDGGRVDDFNINWNTGDGTPQPQSKVISWDVPSGNIGDVIGYSIHYASQGESENAQYNYTYQGQATVTNPVVTNPPTVDNSPTVNNQPTVSNVPFDVKLVVSPDSPTDVDAIDIEAVVSGDYKGSLSYVWSMNNVVMTEETGYKISFGSSVLLPNFYKFVVQVTDGDGNIVSALTTFFVIYGNTGIRGDVLEVNLFDPIPNAKVSATSLTTGVKKTVNVDSDGKYSIHLLPGHYNVSARASGYLTESGIFGDDVKVLSPHDEPYPIDCYTTFNFRLVPEPSSKLGLPRTIKPGSIWKVKEYGPMGNWDGEWVIRKDALTIDASWSGGSIKDIIDIKSIKGNQITLYRQGNKGYYTGTISPDGLSMSGTASWYSPGETWTATPWV